MGCVLGKLNLILPVSAEQVAHIEENIASYAYMVHLQKGVPVTGLDDPKYCYE